MSVNYMITDIDNCMNWIECQESISIYNYSNKNKNIVRVDGYRLYLYDTLGSIKIIWLDMNPWLMVLISGFVSDLTEMCFWTIGQAIT